jgi:hypothetical protein
MGSVRADAHGPSPWCIRVHLTSAVFLATLDEATPLDEEPVFHFGWGRPGQAVILFLLVILPAILGALVGKASASPSDG